MLWAAGVVAVVELRLCGRCEMRRRRSRCGRPITKAEKTCFAAVPARKDPLTVRGQREGKGSGGEGTVVRRCGEVL